ncbi:MAG: undecaprenyl/decaprenyl-phosphate alpha-N-acetylglucosaminyl 1-phosphate transferase [Candidatus Doudnabacteria bacterium]|nr:undecaprenyl/decaprenyl-phosphate alpha-N-acetylglucosaminyl 1-phosphate transferase [Candidatus Doudnabacteria bacterium]
MNSALDTQFFFAAFFAAVSCSFVLTFIIRKLAVKLQVIDYPDLPRKIQRSPVPSLGGLAIYLAFGFVATVSWLSFGPFGKFISPAYLVGILVGGLILMLGGYFDDRYRLPPRYSIIAPVLSAIAILLAGVQLSYINHPLGGALFLDTVKVSGYPVFGGLFVFLWVLGMIYTTKFLDGLDGLASGVSVIAAAVLFFLSRIPAVNQPDTALLAVIFAGATLGFLPWNFHPAKIFLGEGGSTFLGFMIGTLSVIAGGKIATALLVMGVPILDVAWVILRRIANNFSPFVGDRKHLHYRLLDLGLSQRQTVLTLYFISAAFGVSGLFLQSAGKLVALFLLLSVMVVLGTFAVLAYNKKMRNGDPN